MVKWYDRSLQNFWWGFDSLIPCFKAQFLLSFFVIPPRQSTSMQKDNCISILFSIFYIIQLLSPLHFRIIVFVVSSNLSSYLKLLIFPLYSFFKFNSMILILDKKITSKCWLFKQGMRESNPHQKFWRLLSYHLTNPLYLIHIP